MPRVPRPGVFLDRDGVLNVRRKLHVRRREHFEILPGAPEAVARLTKAGLPVCVVTNQPMITMGFTTRREVDLIHADLSAAVKAAGGRIDRIEICEAPVWSRHPCRKPRAGMLFSGAEALDLDLPTSWMVGDQGRDIIAGRLAGCRTILINPTVRARLGRGPILADARVQDLSEAVEWILRNPGSA